MSKQDFLLWIVPCNPYLPPAVSFKENMADLGNDKYSSQG